MRIPAIAAMLVAALSTARAAAAPPRPDEVPDLQKQARAEMRLIEYELAIPLLERALTADSSLAQKAELNADLGICYASLGDSAGARAAFDRALSADMLLDLPVGTSPKIRQLFEGARSAHAKRPSQETAVASTPAEPVGSLIKPVDFVMSAAVVAGVAAGIITGALSSGAASDLQSGLHDRPTVDSLNRRRQNLGVASVCSYGVAGAAAITELALILFLDRHPEPAGSLSVSAAVMPTGGASATLRVHF